MSMEKKIVKDRGAVYCNEGAWKTINALIENIAPSHVFILTDTNTKDNCLPYFKQKIQFPKEPKTLNIPAGETNKTIGSCTKLWEQLSKLGADRKSLLINLGGGVVTDLGGFVASTYQRGIEFINIPTSLLAMVDAAVGGKNGVDLGALKNQVGIIRNAKAVLVDTTFLNTLPENEFISGQAEMIKHGLIHSEDYLEKTLSLDKNDAEAVAKLVWESILIKNKVVTQDPTEQGLRKTLNYGHTLGHAIESYCLENDEKRTLLHGEAIAIGMILANYISSKLFGFPSEKRDKITSALLSLFQKVHFEKQDIDSIIKLLIFDKKNANGKIQFVLLEDIGKYKINCRVENSLINEAFNFYRNS